MKSTGYLFKLFIWNCNSSFENIYNWFNDVISYGCQYAVIHILLYSTKYDTCIHFLCFCFSLLYTFYYCCYDNVLLLPSFILNCLV